MSIDRRHFLKQSALAGGAVISSSLLPLNLFANDEEKNLLTILHTNDVHSHLESFPFDSGQYAGLGGVAARAALIKQIRSDNEHVLLLDAGDIFQGTPYFNIYKGEPDIKAMSMMGYEATTMGNHDFDAGLENFATQLRFAKFPVIICNYDFSHTPMEGKYVPYKIFQKGKMKIGVLGVGIELKGLVPDELFGKTIYLEPIEHANRTAAYLRKQGCDLIVCLSHLGDRYFDDKVSDEILAKECFDIDLIIGGHTHKFFDAPRVYRNRNNGNTLVNQVGWAGLQMGRLDYSLARSQKKSLIKAHTVVVREKTNE